MIDLNKFTNTKRDKMLHSSGHAQLRRSGYGDFSGRKAGTFEQRRNLAGSRGAVGSYSQSRLVRVDRFSSAGGVRSVDSRRSQEGESNSSNQQTALDHNRRQVAGSRQEFNSRKIATPPSTSLGAAPSTRYQFKEPAGRHYDPYS